MVIFIGIDPGIEPTIAFMEDGEIGFDKVASPVIKYPQKPWFAEVARIARMHRLFMECIDSWTLNDELVIGLEGPSYGETFRGITMGAVDLALRTGIRKLHQKKSVYVIAPSTAKKFVTGNGRSSKNEVRLTLNDEFGLDILKSYHDQSDALAVLLTAKDKHNGEN